MTGAAKAYLDELAARVAALMDANADSIERAAAAIAEAAASDRLVYLFGTGHSHMLAEEAHYRAGGPAFTVPILSGANMLHDGAVGGTAMERMPGFAAAVMGRYPIGQGDVLVVASNSGVNAAPVEAADLGRERGATVIAVTSDAYSRAAADGRRRLAEIADITLDNGAPAGDAVVAIPGSTLRAGPVSTAIGAALLNAVLAEAIARLVAAGGEVPVYLSANMPGAAEANAKLIARYRPRNPHL